MVVGGVVGLAAGAAWGTPPVAEAVNTALGLRASSVVEVDVDVELGREVRVGVLVEGRELVLELWPHSVRAPGFELTEQLADGSWREVDPGPINTLRGWVVGQEGSVVVGGMMEDGLYCTIVQGDGSQHWLEPIAGRVAGAGKRDYAVYRNGDAVAGGGCAAAELPAVPGVEVPQGQGGGPERGGTRFYADLATDADYEFYVRWGGTVQVNNRIALIINTMNLQYERDVDITHIISGSRVRTAEPDPYTTTDPTSLLLQFTNHWNAFEGSVVRDVAHLFTGKVLNSGQGTAWTAQICGSNAYGLSATGPFSFMGATDVTAHQLGHSWGASDCACTNPDSTMNPMVTGVNRFGVNVNDTADTAIPAYRNSRFCLSTAFTGLTPPNNDCANAELVGVGSFGFNNLNATTDAPPIPEACGGLGDDIWYLFIPECDGTVSVSTCTFTFQGEPGFDTAVAVYAGACGSLTEVACNDDAPCTVSEVRSTLSFEAARGVSYRIRVGGWAGSNGEGRLSLAMVPACLPPVNDNCSAAISIYRDVDYPFSTAAATTDGPFEPASCTFFSYGHVGSDIWYRYIAPCSGQVRVSTCGSSFDTKLAVYGGTCPTVGGSPIVCNDDNGPVCAGTRSSVEFTAFMSSTYLIRVGGYDNAQGVGILRVESVGCPVLPNDFCGGATPLPGPGNYSGTLVGASHDTSITCLSPPPEWADAWYSFTAPANLGGGLTLSTCGSRNINGPGMGPDTVLSLHDGCGGAQLACNDDFGECGGDVGQNLDSLVKTVLAPGQTVLIRVSRWPTSQTHPFLLQLTFPNYDDCEAAGAAEPGATGFSNGYAVSPFPLDPGLCRVYRDIWYRFTSPCSVPMRAVICDADFDAELNVYSAACPVVGPELACNDDSCGTGPQVTFATTEGASYLIRIGGAERTEIGTGSLTVLIATDWDESGTVNSGDISSYLTWWLGSISGGNRQADFNNDNVVNSMDISAFLTAWLATVTADCP